MDITKRDELTLTGARELQTELLRCLEAREPVVLNLEAVTEVDLASLQVLLAAERCFAAKGLPLKIHESDCVLRSRAQAGYPTQGDT